MSFPAEIFESGIATASALLDGTAVDVTHYAWESTDGEGKDTFDTTGVSMRAIVNSKRRQIPRAGRMVTIVATLTILNPVAPNGATGRSEPIDVRDKFVLPNGLTGPIVGVGTVLNPNTGYDYYQKVELGEL